MSPPVKRTKTGQYRPREPMLEKFRIEKPEDNLFERRQYILRKWSKILDFTNKHTNAIEVQKKLTTAILLESQEHWLNASFQNENRNSKSRRNY